MKILKSLMIGTTKVGMLLMISFIAFVKTPVGLDRRYVVESFEIVGNGQVYQMKIKGSGQIVYAPVIFTIIEESK